MTQSVWEGGACYRLTAVKSHSELQTRRDGTDSGGSLRY